MLYPVDGSTFWKGISYSQGEYQLSLNTELQITGLLAWCALLKAHELVFPEFCWIQYWNRNCCIQMLAKYGNVPT